MERHTPNPAISLITLFLIGIGVGTLLLKLPIATTTPISWLDAAFTATSAMTVTGLVTLSTAYDFTYFGQVIIMLLIQIGGLGITTFAIFIFVLLGKKIGLKKRLAIQFMFNQTSLTGMVRLIRVVLVYSLLVEAVIASFLAVRFIPLLGVGKGIYYSIFHAISAFNNAGFALWDDSLVQFAHDPLVIFPISVLITLGGLGFTVLVDLWHYKTHKRLSLHSKLMIGATLFLQVGATLLLFALLYRAGSVSEQLYEAYFQAVTTRTAGFNSVDMGSLPDSALVIMVLLMFIGGGSASTAGGIKVTTFIILLATTFHFLRARKEVVVLHRTIRSDVVSKALALTTTSLLWIGFVIFCLTITEDAPFLTLVVETVSAFGTVGLSVNFTASLSIIGKLLIMATMILGKVGPLTLLFALGQAQPAKIGYPHEDVAIG